MKKSAIFALFCLFILIFLSFKIEESPRYSFKTHSSLGETTLNLAIIEKSEDLVRGLSGVSTLGDKEGLLFMFPVSNRAGIWMKDMNFAIDVIWFDENMKVVSIKENFTPDSYPEVAYPSADSRYVLEVISGFVKANKILLGDELKILINSL